MISDKTTCPKFSNGDYVEFRNGAIGVIIDYDRHFLFDREYLYAVKLVSGTYPQLFCKMSTWEGVFPAFNERTLEKLWIYDTKLGELL